MAFGIRDTPVDDSGKPYKQLYACPNCGKTFPPTPQGKNDFKKHVKDRDMCVPE